MTKSEKLLARLAAECKIKIPPGTTIDRTHAGMHQRNTGAWSWVANCEGCRYAIGSQYPVSELLKHPGLEATEEHAGNISIDPAPDGVSKPFKFRCGIGIDELNEIETLTDAEFSHYREFRKYLYFRLA